MRPLSWARSGCESAKRAGDLGLDRRPGVERRRLGRGDGVAIAADVALPRDLLKRPWASVRSAARPAWAPTPSTAVSTAISSSAPRSSVLPNAWPTRWIASRSRSRSSWSSSSRRSSWRAISLNWMPSPANSSLPSVGTSTPKSPWAICRAAVSSRWICDCSERETVIANANAAISAAIRIASTSSAAPLSPPSWPCASSRTETRPPSKAGPSKPVRRMVSPPISTSPRAGSFSAPASGSVEKTISVPAATTTSVPVTRSTSRA